MVTEEVFVNCYGTILILLHKSKKKILKVSHKTNRSRGWSRSRNSDLRLRGAVAERNIFGSATLPFGENNGFVCTILMQIVD
jgi:hypothetical protein